jgi:DNA-binding CsgD family transcriptional regulator
MFCEHSRSLRRVQKLKLAKVTHLTQKRNTALASSMNNSFLSDAASQQTPGRGGEQALRWRAGLRPAPAEPLPVSYWQAALGGVSLLPSPSAAPSHSMASNSPLAWALLDQLAVGVVVLQVGGGVSFANASARAELAHNPWLRIERGQLCARRASDVQNLQDLLWAAARGEHSVLWLGLAKPKAKAKSANSALGKEAPRAKAVGAAAHPASFVITATPLPLAQHPTGLSKTLGTAYRPTLAHTDEPNHKPSHIALIFTRRQLCEPLMLHHFARQHHLTSTEENVLRQLCENAEQQGVASSLGIAVSTVRSHIKSIAQKTGFHSMRALQAHLASLPPLATLAPSPAPGGHNP